MQNSDVPLIFTDLANPNIIYRGLKGHKKLTSQLNRNKKLKIKNLRQTSFGRYQLQIESEIQKYESSTAISNLNFNGIKNKSFQLKNHYLKSQRNKQEETRLSRQLNQKDKRTEQQTHLMIKTNKNFNNLPVKQDTKNFPTFYSKNFHEKMNQYLNLVVQKSFQDQNKKLKDLQQKGLQIEAIDLLKKNKQRNYFYRKMKQHKLSKGYQTERSRNQFEYSQKRIQNLIKLNQLKQRQRQKITHMKHSMSVQLTKQRRNLQFQRSHQLGY